MGVLRFPPGRFEKHRLPKNAFVTSDPQSAFKKASEVILAVPPERLAAQGWPRSWTTPSSPCA